MKKKIIAATVAAAVCLACVPAFSGCSAQTDFTLKVDGDGNKYYVAGCSGFSNSLKGEYVIPEYYGEGEDYAPVTEIAEQGFASTRLTKITVPKTVTKIGTAAFSFNNYLSAVVFGDGINLKEIPHGAFGNCYSLSEISIPDTVTEIGALSFCNCYNLVSLSLNSVETVGVRAFDGCTALEEITFSDSLTTISDMAFYNTGLTSVIIPDSVHDIVKPVTDDGGNQKTDEDGNPLTRTINGIGTAAFYNCASLKLAVVGSGVTSIPCGAFGECTSLTELYLPAGLKEIKGAYYSETDKSYLFGHAFISVPLTDLYFAGSEEEWTELKKNTDNTPIVQNGVTSDNSSLFSENLKIHYETTYTK